MSNYLQLLKHPLTILLTSLMLFTIAITWYFITQSTHTPPVITDNPSVNTGGLPKKNFTQAKNFIKKEAAPNNKTRYLYASPLENRPNEIVTNEGDTVLFEREVLEQNPQTPTINQYKDSFGPPDATYIGSEFYGIQPVTYIYSQIGIAFIGDSNGNIVEIQKFQPMSIEEYIATHGEDIEIDHNH